MLVVVLSGRDALPALESVNRLGVQLGFDESSYKAMFDAIDKVMSVKDGRLFDLREVLLGGVEPKFLDFSPIRFPWLNASQESAINKILRAKDVAIVHGPPGTGKTTTLVEAIYETLRRETQVLVCAQSNMAVDWISEQLQDRGISVLRIGNPSRVDDKMLSSTYERRFESHPKYDTLWSMRKTVRELYRTNKDKARAVKEKAEALEYEIRESLFSDSRVVACTLVGAANPILYGRNFQSLFIDEAAQALEAACWIPITKSHRVILAGDHKQLPPTIKCFEAERSGLSYTLMEKLAETKPMAVSLLNVQYRMHESIMRFSSEWFYDGKLKAAEEVKCRGVLDFENPLEWINTEELSFEEEYLSQSAGRVNRMEGELTIALLTQFIEKIGPDRVKEEQIDFGIISPYKEQVYFLRHLIKESKFLKPFRKYITVNSVDGFQGQERDVVIISLVRSNETGEIGFLKELRRMNVAMTRARMKLMIIGNVATLSHHAFYRKLWEWVEKTKNSEC
jgi:superfamily I DNA and/or RNA helicase